MEERSVETETEAASIVAPSGEASAADELPESITVKLRRPIQAHGKTVTELVVKEPSPRDLQAMDRVQGEVSKINALLAEVCQVPISSIYQLRMRDYEPLIDALYKLGFTGLSTESSG